MRRSLVFLGVLLACGSAHADGFSGNSLDVLVLTQAIICEDCGVALKVGSISPIRGWALVTCSFLSVIDPATQDGINFPFVIEAFWPEPRDGTVQIIGTYGSFTANPSSPVALTVARQTWLNRPAYIASQQPEALGNGKINCDVQSGIVHLTVKDRFLSGLPDMPSGTPVILHDMNGNELGLPRCLRSYRIRRSVPRLAIRPRRLILAVC
jgi:hypothetical protein